MLSWPRALAHSWPRARVSSSAEGGSIPPLKERMTALMPFQSAPGVIGVVVHGRLSGQLTNNTLYFHQNGADPTVGDCSAIASLVASWWNSEVLPSLNQNLIMVKVVAKNLVVNGGAKAVASMGGQVGGVTSEQAPNNIAPCITYDTGQSGKSSHGRNYIPGISNSDVADNDVEAAWANTILGAYQTLLPGGTHDPTPYFWSVLSRQAAGVVLANAIAVPVLNVYFNDTTVDSQRRRLPGRGK
jgi:hypothetical protein